MNMLNKTSPSLPHSIRKQEWEKNRDYFHSHRSILKTQFPKQCVAIHEGEVVYSGDTLGEVADWVYTNKGNLPFYADFVEEQPVEVLNFPLSDI